MTTIFYNGPIYGNTESEAVLVVSDSIYHIGSLAECEALATEPIQRINLGGRMLLPAFTDAHTHFVEYSKARLLVNLLDCRSIEDIKKELRHYRDKLQWKAEWILGGGWNRNVLEQAMSLNRDLLDEIWPDTPVALFSRDYHAKLLNSSALRIVGIDDNYPDPEGGTIERDEHGKATGVLFETATELVDPFVIHPPEDIMIKAIQDTVQEIYAWGLIGFHSMEYEASAQLLRTAQKKGSMFRYCWHFQASELDSMIARELRSYDGDEYFKIGGLKLFGDGSLGSRTAAMYDPYHLEAENRGILRYRDEELFRIMEKGAKAGFASTIHAIGDRCVRQVIDATMRLKKVPEYAALFHRIEHVQSIRLQDIPLLKQSGLFASLQPVHIANDIPMIDAHWPHIKQEVYAFRSMLDAGIPIAFGSDVPIETMNPFLGIYSAIMRKHQCNPANESWCPAEAITAEQAIDAYSIGAGQASCSEQIRGKIAKGFLADFIVLEDYRKLEAEYWLQAKSLITMIGGTIVHNEL